MYHYLILIDKRIFFFFGKYIFKDGKNIMRFEYTLKYSINIVKFNKCHSIDWSSIELYISLGIYDKKTKKMKID